MRNRKAALVMSFMCPGLGQIYKREVLKGISFIMICTLLLLPLFFFSSPSRLPYFFGISILLLMWLVSIVDAYVNDEFIMERGRWLIWQKLLAVLSAAVISLAVIALMVLWAQDSSEMNRRLVVSTDSETAQNIHILQDRPDHTGTDTGISVESNNQEFFSVQVASFRDLERAEEAYRDLLSKEYTVKIERSMSQDEVWHRILVGEFRSRQDAISFTEKLRDREGFSDMMVHRWATDKESADSLW